MSENTKRVELKEEEVTKVVGGNIQAVIANGQIYIYGTHNPDAHFGFSNYQAIIKFVNENYDLYGEAGTIQAMVAAGLAWPL